MVTSNHVHILLSDRGNRDVIPRSIQLIAGRVGQEFHQRKARKGAYWEDRPTIIRELPEGGTYPKELLALGVREYREIFFEMRPFSLAPTSYHSVSRAPRATTW